MASFVSNLIGAPSGLLGQIEWRLELDDVDGTIIIPQTSDLITEQVNGDTSTYIRVWVPTVAGTYLPIFVDPVAGDLPDVRVIVDISDVEGLEFNFKPNVQDVAALMRARTKDSKMREVGNFTENTRPTVAEAMLLIDQGTRDVASIIGGDAPVKLLGDAQSVAALRSAMLIELSYWPEQINNNMSPYSAYKRLYDDSLARLVKAVSGETAAGEGGTDPQGNPIPMPSYSYPDNEGIDLGTIT